MYPFIHPRGRTLPALLLGLFGLTCYAYYRITLNDPHQYIMQPLVSNCSTFLEALPIKSGGNLSADVHSPCRNASLAGGGQQQQQQQQQTSSQVAPSGINAIQQNSTNSSSPTTLVSIPYNSQSPSLAQTLLNSIQKSGQQVVANSAAAIADSTKQTSNVMRIESNPAVPAATVISNDSTRAIYEPGYDEAVPDKCQNFGKDMDLLIIIMSAPTHIEARTAIRQTWGHYGQRKDVGIMFLLGATTDAKIEKILKREEDIYGDMIRARFLDSYSNLTLKTVSILEWVDTYCSEAKFVLKTDDDMFINVPRLLAFVRKHANDKNVIFGRLAKKWKPIRSKKSKYYVSMSQYKQSVFPDFTTGPAYLMSSAIVPRLYAAALDHTYLKLEDVFITGIIAHSLGIKRAHATEFFNKRISYSPCNVQRGISIHMVKYSEQFDLWKKLLDGKSKCK